MTKRSFIQWLSDHPMTASIFTFVLTSMLLHTINSYSEQMLNEENTSLVDEDNEYGLKDAHHQISNISHSTMGTQKCPHQVCSHIRNLSDGKSPSWEKKETAQKYGYVLSEHQTWVESYRTGKTM